MGREGSYQVHSHHPPHQGETRCLTWAQPGAATCLGGTGGERANWPKRQVSLLLQRDKVPAKKSTANSLFALLREVKNNKQRHTAGADVFNSSVLTSSSSSPPAHRPTLSAGIQWWECDAEDRAEPFPNARAIPRSSHPSLSQKPPWDRL